MSANGLIATENGDTPWSDAIWKSYYRIAKQFKAIILGRRTYEIMKSVGEFEKIGNPFTVVVTTQKMSPEENVIFVQSPQEAANLLKKKKYSKAMLGGGGIVNGSFMKENLIDEIILDVEPVIFGKGVNLFGETNFEARLKLVGTKKLSKNEIQMHYKVVKKK